MKTETPSSVPSIILVDDPSISSFYSKFRSDGLFLAASIFHDTFDGEGTLHAGDRRGFFSRHDGNLINRLS